jgi:hypothetical protein
VRVHQTLVLDAGPKGEREKRTTHLRPAGCSLLAPGLAVGFHGLFLWFNVKRQGPI